MDRSGETSLIKRRRGRRRARCAVPTPWAAERSAAELLPGDDPVATRVPVVVPVPDVAPVVLVGGPGGLHAAGLGRIERVRPVVAPVAEVVAVQSLLALVLPGAGTRGGLGALGGVVAVLVTAVVGIGLLVDAAAREEHGGSRQRERQEAHEELQFVRGWLRRVTGYSIKK